MMSEALLEAFRPLVEAALREDRGPGDVTSEWTVPEGVSGSAGIVARSAGVVCGLELAEMAFRLAGEDLRTALLRSDGDRVSAGDRVLEVEGPLRPLLGAERTALNFLARLSGVATAARRFVDAVEGTGCRILDTRKTTPGWRALEKYAARSGGATNHRAGLWDMVLIKENHVRVAGGVRAALDAVARRAAEARVEVEIEVTTPDELDEALAGSPDRILLDNMTVAQLEVAVARVRSAPPPRPLLEASGGVTLATVRRIAESGVDFVSVGAITHSAPALDLSLLVRRP
jgi:nicotinate-nucleotide pyrophosphorylase (carboxylating)